jgi:hypothetical protein
MPLARRSFDDDRPTDRETRLLGLATEAIATPVITGDQATRRSKDHTRIESPDCRCEQIGGDEQHTKIDVPPVLLISC